MIQIDENGNCKVCGYLGFHADCYNEYADKYGLAKLCHCCSQPQGSHDPGCMFFNKVGTIYENE